MMAWMSIWWVWLSAALVLGVIEVLAPGFIFLGFAISAVVMAALAGLGLIPSTPFATLAMFAILSLVAWIILRRAFQLPTGNAKVFKEDINDN